MVTADFSVTNSPPGTSKRLSPRNVPALSLEIAARVAASERVDDLVGQFLDVDQTVAPAHGDQPLARGLAARHLRRKVAEHRIGGAHVLLDDGMQHRAGRRLRCRASAAESRGPPRGRRARRRRCRSRRCRCDEWSSRCRRGSRSPSKIGVSTVMSKKCPAESHGSLVVTTSPGLRLLAKMRTRWEPAMASELIWPGVPVLACATMRPRRSNSAQARSPASRTTGLKAMRCSALARSVTMPIRLDHRISSSTPSIRLIPSAQRYSRSCRPSRSSLAECTVVVSRSSTIGRAGQRLARRQRAAIIDRNGKPVAPGVHRPRGLGRTWHADGRAIARLNGMMGPRAVTRQVTSSIGTWDGLTP